MIQRYWILSALFGAVFGIRFTLDVWVLQQVTIAAAAKFQFIGVTIAGMLIGELCAGPVSDRVGRTLAVQASALSIAAWAVLAMLAIKTASPVLFVWGALMFGIGFGLFHSSLDAWFCDRCTTAALELRLTQGYFFYNAGYLLGSSLAFPLLLAFQWDANLISATIAPSLAPWPYLVAISLLVGVVLTLRRDATVPAIRQRPAIRGVTARQVLGDYLSVLSRGGSGLASVLFVAGSIALIVQLIDHLAPAVLLSGATLKDKAANVFLFNLTVCVFVGLLQIALHRLGGVGGVDASMRSAIVKFAMACVTLLLGLCFLAAHRAALADKPWIGLVLGLAQALLLMLPPLMKAWVLEFNVSDRYATTLAVLGVSKRLFAIVATLCLPWFVHAAGTQSGSETVTLYALTATVALITLSLLLCAATRRRQPA
jgi:MFS family permease